MRPAILCRSPFAVRRRARGAAQLAQDEAASGCCGELGLKSQQDELQNTQPQRPQSVQCVCRSRKRERRAGRGEDSAGAVTSSCPQHSAHPGSFTPPTAHICCAPSLAAPRLSCSSLPTSRFMETPAEPADPAPRVFSD